MNGVFYAHVMTVAGPRRISIRTRDEAEAHARARESKLAELEAAAKINALTVETVGRIVTGSRVTGLDALTQWAASALIAGLTPNTRERYEMWTRVFLRQTGFEARSVGGVHERHVDTFVNPQDSGIVVSTRKNRLAAMVSFIGFAQAAGFIIGNPAAFVRVRLSGLRFNQKESKRRVPFTDEELTLLRSIEQPFWATFVLLGENFGLRLSDVALLERGCIAKSGIIVVWTQKTNRRLELPLPRHIREHLESVEPSHPTLFFPREAAIARDSKRRSILSTEFGRLLRRLGIRGKSAHCLRNTFATKQANLGICVDEIRKQLGHVSAETTNRYLDVP